MTVAGNPSEEALVDADRASIEIRNVPPKLATLREIALSDPRASCGVLTVPF
jgi:hypothetical protein